MKRTSIERFVAFVCLFFLPALLSACGESRRYYSDYDAMWAYIETEYPLLPAARRITGKDFAQVKQDHRKKIRGVTSDVEFFRQVVEPCLAEFEHTGHMAALDASRYVNELIALEASAAAIYGSSKEGYLLEQLKSPQTIAFYRALNGGDLPALFGSSGKETVTWDERRPNLYFAWYPEHSAAYLSVKTMAPVWKKAGPRLVAFFSQIEEEGYENCIIDIRGNSGGSDGFWWETIVLPNLAQPVEWGGYGLVKGELCKQYLELGGDALVPIAELPVGQLPRLDASDLQEAAYYSTGANSMVPCAGAPLFRGRFWVLMDEAVYSSADAFCQFCRATNFATLVGVPTDGDGRGSTPLVISLPNTGICFCFSAANILNPDGSSSEEYGTAPDIFISGSEDALTRCFKEIDRLAGK